MPALRPSNELQNKSNVRPTNNRFTEAWAEDFNEIGGILTDHADILDSLTGSVSPSPFYGTFDSLATLEAAFPVAEENAYAIIDAGVGSTPQVAVWNDTTQQWEGGDYTSSIVWLNNIEERPITGFDNTLYIIKDSGKIYYWFSGVYELLNEVNANSSTEIEIDNNRFRYVGANVKSIEIGDIAAGGMYEYNGQKYFGDLKLIDNTGDITTGIGTKWQPLTGAKI